MAVVVLTGASRLGKCHQTTFVWHDTGTITTFRATSIQWSREGCQGEVGCGELRKGLFISPEGFPLVHEVFVTAFRENGRIGRGI